MEPDSVTPSADAAPPVPPVTLPSSPAPAPAQAPRWNYQKLAIALVVSFILQGIFLPCLCARGDAQITYALYLDGLVLIRLLFASITHERGRGWIFYLALLYLSPLWINLMVGQFFRLHH